jgi:AmmeMemoRadiSam system protein B
MDRPKLRQVDRYELQRGDEDLLVVRDPLGLAQPFAIDTDFKPVLDLLDGTRTLPQIRQSLLMAHGLDLPAPDLAAFVTELSNAGLLQDDAFADLWADAHADFLEAPHREARLAGLLYPADPAEASRVLAHALPDRPDRFLPGSDLIGAVVPHGPPAEVAGLWDMTLRRLPPASELECIVVLGTDHGPGLLPYVTTRKPFQTPLGVVPTATRLLEALERRVDWIEREEIRHRDAMSIEIAAVAIRALYGDDCPPIVPVLCGQTVLQPAHDDTEPVEQFIRALDALCDDRPVLWWVSAELSHCGPAYGHPALGEDEMGTIIARDGDVLDALAAGRAEEVAVRCAAPHPQGRQSGGPALTTAARLLPVGFRAHEICYELAPAPGPTPGRVGRAGIRFYGPLADPD